MAGPLTAALKKRNINAEISSAGAEKATHGRHGFFDVRLKQSDASGNRDRLIFGAKVQSVAEGTDPQRRYGYPDVRIGPNGELQTDFVPFPGDEDFPAFIDFLAQLIANRVNTGQ